MFVFVLETASSIVWPAGMGQCPISVEREVPSLGVFRDETSNCRDEKQRAGNGTAARWYGLVRTGLRWYVASANEESQNRSKERVHERR